MGAALARLLVALVLLTSCADGSSPGAASDRAAASRSSVDDEASAPAAGSDADDSGGSGDCDEEFLTDGDDAFDLTTVYRIEDGRLGGLCLGAEDELLVDAWEALTTITPAGQLDDVAVFAGFDADGASADDTFAYVSALDDEGTAFQMSLNLQLAEEDEAELLLTLAHEFSHVFTATPSQVDRSDQAFEDCATYLSSDGCFRPGSFIAGWVEAFWDADLLATVDGNADTVDQDEDALAATDERCAADDGFFGSYAATNPEEDFAEAFSAFVFDVAPRTDGQAERLEWFEQQPDLVAFRDRARSAGLTPIDNAFDVCGV